MFQIMLLVIISLIIDFLLRTLKIVNYHRCVRYVIVNATHTVAAESVQRLQLRGHVPVENRIIKFNFTRRASRDSVPAMLRLSRAAQVTRS